MSDKNIFRDTIRSALRRPNGKLGSHIDEHYLRWSYGYHRQEKVNPMNGHSFKRPAVVYL